MLRIRRNLQLAAASTFVASFGGIALVSTGHDDAYITFWPVHTLSAFGEILNYDLERVEQSSSLLHTLLLAGLHTATGFSIPLLSWVVGVGFGVLTVVRAVGLSEALGRRPGWALPLVIGTAPAFLYWWFSGLETAMVT